MYKPYLMLANIFLSFSFSANAVDLEDKNVKAGGFSVEQSLQALTVIGEAMQSFKLMTVKSENEEPVILKNFQHTDWEMQNIAIPNGLMAIEGLIRRQKYIISKLEYKLMSMKASGSKAHSKKLKKLEKQLFLDKKAYTTYFDSLQPVD